VNVWSSKPLHTIKRRSEGEPLEFDGVAVLIPCLNEDMTIGKVVKDFRYALPGAMIFVYDNNSTDKTASIAQEMGATVIPAPRQGKGRVVKQMFDEVEADIYVMVDGDDTYPASSAGLLIAEVRESGTDMVVGVRMSSFTENSFRRFHRLGNHLIAKLISLLFSAHITDVLSGYRVFSKDFVKSIPLKSKGFEVETEMTLQALAKDFVIKEVPIPYGERPKGSHSKLSTFTDGYLVLRAILMIFKDYKPLMFFSLLSAFLFLMTLVAGIWPILDYIHSRYVYHVPLAILASAIGILSTLSISIGLILDTICKYHLEQFELMRRFLKKTMQGPPYVKGR
jgi:glycosyltransferase involved in cell wall biosynthesis